MIVGLTGGIGAGKTTVAKLFESLHIPIYYADVRAKALYTEDPSLKLAVIDLVGERAYLSDGSLDRSFLAAQVFSDKHLLDGLNGLVHPAVARDFEKWYEKHQKAPYVLREAAILFESGAYRDCSFVINVSAPVDVRIQRVIVRDNSEAEAVKERMANQWTEEQRLMHADFVIHNDGSESLIEQVLEIHRTLLVSAAQK